jgi:Tol biopolymer transport system component
VIAPDGTEKQELTHGIRLDNNPVWLASGEQIAFHSSDGGRSFIRTVTLSDETETTVVQIPVGDNLLYDWSPDGQTLTYFGFSPAGAQEIVKLDMITDLRTPITRANAVIDFMSYSFDRTRILYTSIVQGRRQIFIANNLPNCTLITDCDSVQLTEGTINYSYPRFSPDGTTILASSDELGNLDIVLLDLEGTLIRRITETPLDDYNAVWQP